MVSGVQTKFWENMWCDSGCKLKDMFPRLFAIETVKSLLVNDRWIFLMDLREETGNGGVRLQVAHQVIWPLSLK